MKLNSYGPKNQNEIQIPREGQEVAPDGAKHQLSAKQKTYEAGLNIGLIARFTSMKMDNMKMILLDNIICDTDSWYWYLMIVFFKSYVTVAKTIEVKYRDVLCIGSTLV